MLTPEERKQTIEDIITKARTLGVFDGANQYAAYLPLCSVYISEGIPPIIQIVENFGPTDHALTEEDKKFEGIRMIYSGTIYGLDKVSKQLLQRPLPNAQLRLLEIPLRYRQPEFRKPLEEKDIQRFDFLLRYAQIQSALLRPLTSGS